jgi:hypothetical protein
VRPAAQIVEELVTEAAAALARPVAPVSSSAGRSTP